MSFYRIEEVWKWGEDRGLYEHSTFEAQMVKLIEEAGELLQAINANDKEKVKDAIGDCMVVIGHLVKFAGTEGATAILSPDSTPSKIGPFARWGRFIREIGRTVVSVDHKRHAGFLIGDVIYHLKCIAVQFELTLEQCIDHVIPIINARTGKFNEHGLYVKDPQPVAESSLAGNVISVK